MTAAQERDLSAEAHKVGCTILHYGYRQACHGHNDVPHNLRSGRNPIDRRRLIVHAEVDAMFKAPFPLTSTTMIVTQPPCTRCAPLIVRNGIKAVWCPKPSTDDMRDARELLLKAAIDYVELEEDEFDIIASNCNDSDPRDWMERIAPGAHSAIS